jgi:hypothetical protein
MGERLAEVEAIAIDTVLNLLFRCAHRHLTRPFTPLDKQGVPHGETYVVCLDCTKQFAYDLTEMKIGEAIDHSHDAWMMPPDMRKPRNTMLVYALGVAVPIAVLLGAALRAKKPAVEKRAGSKVRLNPGESKD